MRRSALKRRYGHASSHSKGWYVEVKLHGNRIGRAGPFRSEATAKNARKHIVKGAPLGAIVTLPLRYA